MINDIIKNLDERMEKALNSVKVNLRLFVQGVHLHRSSIAYKWTTMVAPCQLTNWVRYRSGTAYAGDHTLG